MIDIFHKKEMNTLSIPMEDTIKNTELDLDNGKITLTALEFKKLVMTPDLLRRKRTEEIVREYDIRINKKLTKL